MQINDFLKLTGLAAANELEKVRLLAFFYHKTKNLHEFKFENVLEWFQSLHFHSPNASRLKLKISNSRSFVKGKEQNTWKLFAVDLDELQEKFPGLVSDSEEILSIDTILPSSLYQNTRGFIESLSKQINASYEYNLFDGCAVLMRRLMEVLLILTYENLNIESAIKDGNGSYCMLEKIISDAKTNAAIKLSRNAKEALEEFRTLGNFSAHKIYFNCRRADLKNITMNYRATIEELLYKSGIKK